MKHKIIIGDCKKVLKKLPDNSVHLVITSPPYNVGIGVGRDGWTDKLPDKEYLKLTKTWLRECYRVLADGGKICVNLPLNDTSNIACLHLKIMKELGFTFKTNIIWVKWDSKRKEKFSISKWRIDKFKFPNQPNPIMLNVCEVILVMQKNKGYSRGQKDLTLKEFERLRYNCWFLKPIAKRDNHPAPYPVKLTDRLIKLYSLAGQTVLDPFVGIGTTSISAIKLGRNSIGIEMNSEYVGMIKNRLDDCVVIERD